MAAAFHAIVLVRDLQVILIAAMMTNGILIADDSGAFRKAVRIYLILQNLEVCGEAIDGIDVLEKATELTPALVILDLRMPHMNGVEVASVLKGRMPNLRIVLLTMYAAVLDCKSLMAAIGVDAAIPKMGCFDSLAECVRSLLSQPRSHAAASRCPEPAEIITGTVTHNRGLTRVTP